MTVDTDRALDAPEGEPGDAAANRPASAYHLVGSSRAPYGPLPGAEVAAAIRQGRVGEATLSWSAGEASWTPLGERAEFAADFAARREGRTADGAPESAPAATDEAPAPAATGAEAGAGADAERRYARPGEPPTPHECTVAMWMHLSGLLGLFFPLVGFAAPFVLWLTHKDQSRFLDRHGYVQFDAWISYFLYAVVGVFLAFVCVGFLVLAALLVLSIVGTIVVAVAASRGEVKPYPLAFKILGPQGQD